jgi:phosphopantetheinyl transferase (holo-ACP synthase)
MPIIINQQINEDVRLIVWHITENIPQLQELVNPYVTDLSRPKTENLHWLSSRACIAAFFCSPFTVNKDHANKPNLLLNGQSYHLSISHSFQYAAVIFSKHMEVGIDIEKIDERIDRVKNKFCNETELKWADTDITKLAIIWSSKETLYKFYGKKEIDFKKQLLITPLDDNSVMGKIETADFFLINKIHIQRLGEYIITYTLK